MVKNEFHASWFRDDSSIERRKETFWSKRSTFYNQTKTNSFSFQLTSPFALDFSSLKNVPLFFSLSIKKFSAHKNVWILLRSWNSECGNRRNAVEVSSRRLNSSVCTHLHLNNHQSSSEKRRISTISLVLFSSRPWWSAARRFRPRHLSTAPGTRKSQGCGPVWTAMENL